MDEVKVVYEGQNMTFYLNNFPRTFSFSLVLVSAKIADKVGAILMMIWLALAGLIASFWDCWKTLLKYAAYRYFYHT